MSWVQSQKNLLWIIEKYSNGKHEETNEEKDINQQAQRREMAV
jgi:hypothetical protein